MTNSSSARSLARQAGVGLAWLITGGLNVVAIGCVLFLWISWLSGDYRTDHDLLDGGGSWILVTAVIGGGSALLSLLIDAGAVRLRWMPRWTIWAPSVLLAATALAYAATG
ncbi:MAG TPA: hypothetical protein VN408_04825 [Actinoplanes sp.]|nr:hypothetical protein [Actinoplanes sp.]